MARKRRPGIIRTKSGARGSADPTLSSSSIGILRANEVLDEDAYLAAQRYCRAYNVAFGRTWSHIQDPLRCCAWGGQPRGDASYEWAERMSDRWNREVTEQQRQQVANVAVFGFLPGWYLTQKLKWGPLPEDEAEKQALVEGLGQLARAMGIKQRVRTGETASWSASQIASASAALFFWRLT
jgi:hypothetical protein